MTEPQALENDAFLNLDGWYNQLVGMAQANRDKRESDCIAMQSVSYDTAMAVYQASWLAARIVDKPVDEMTREGWDFHVSDDEDVGKEIEDYHESLCLTEHVRKALKWQRLFGGALVLIGANDGVSDLSQPLNEKAVKSIDYINVFDPMEARPVTWQDNPAAADYGQPLMFRIEPLAIGNEEARKDVKETGIAGQMLVPALRFVHASRCFMFQGTLISRRHMQIVSNANIGRGWGDGVLARCIKLIRDFEGAWDGTSYALREFSQAIFTIQGLAQSLLADKGQKGDNYIQRRMRTIDMSRSLIRAVMLDKDGEGFERNDTTFTGVADTLREFSTIIAALADMPVSVLMGSQGGGLGASGSGQNDIQNWYASVKGQQVRSGLRAFLMRMAELCLMADDGPDAKMVEDPRTGEMEPEELKIEFRSLQQLSDMEQAELYGKLAVADEKYLNMGALSALDIGKARFSGKPLKVTIVADMNELKTREEQTAEMATTQHETVVSNLQTHGQEVPPPPPKPAPKK